MPIVTVQLGQCGNQLGASWFDALAQELRSGTYGSHAADAFFEPSDSSSDAGAAQQPWAARAVLVDMEPKVIYAAKQRASKSSLGWSYASGCSAAGQSGSGNNWALGHNKFGPAIAAPVLELMRRQVEACDCFEGCLMLQSMAGGTGAGAGTFLAEALADEYDRGHLLNCCVWPFESGEVAVQPYNTLLSMAALAEVSSGVLLLQNEALHATCSRLLGIKHPGFKDLNAVAARGLTSALLPCRARALEPSSVSSGSHAQAGSGAAGRGRTAAEATQQEQPGPVLHPLADLVCHLFGHPSYRVSSFRCVPQVAAASLNFTTFTWHALLGRLRAMSLAGVYVEENLSGFIQASSSPSAMPAHKFKNKAASAMLLLRGSEAAGVPVAEFSDPRMFAPWAVDPLLVASHPAKFGGCQMSATLLATDQAGVAPLRAMQARAYSMLAARAYTHQYEAHGLGVHELQHCFAVVEDVLAAYAGL